MADRCRRCSIKKHVLKNFAKHLFQSRFLIKLQAETCNFNKKETLAQSLSCEFWKIIKNSFFIEHLRWLDLVNIYALTFKLTALVKNFKNNKLRSKKSYLLKWWIKSKKMWVTWSISKEEGWESCRFVLAFFCIFFWKWWQMTYQMTYPEVLGHQIKFHGSVNTYTFTITSVPSRFCPQKLGKPFI